MTFGDMLINFSSVYTYLGVELLSTWVYTFNFSSYFQFSKVILPICSSPSNLKLLIASSPH